jgi:hypothetical protein
MANAPEPPQAPEPHPLVKELLGEADPPGDLVLLVGYFGPPKKPGYKRLYLGLDFQAYFEIPEDGIVRAVPVDSNPYSPTHVIVKAATRLELVKVSSQVIEASYLQGGIASANLGGAIGAQAASAAAASPIATQPQIAPLHPLSGLANPIAKGVIFVGVPLPIFPPSFNNIITLCGGCP